MKKICCLLLSLSFSGWPLAHGEEFKECPFYTSGTRDDEEVFVGLQNYFKARATMEECAKMSSEGIKGVVDFQAGLKDMNERERKCVEKNMKLDQERKRALDQVGSRMEVSGNYSDCNGSVTDRLLGVAVPSDKKIKCINERYRSFVDETSEECKNKNVPESFLDRSLSAVDQVYKGVSETFAPGDPCGLSVKGVLKTTTGILEKTKFLTNLLPWGAVTREGVSYLTELIPSENSAMASMFNDLLKTESYEQTACMYHEVQKKMYCESSLESGKKVSDEVCNQPPFEFVQLLGNIRDISEATYLVSNGIGEEGHVDTSLLEFHIDDLIKYAKASEPDIRKRLKLLPKVQQSIETKKIDAFYELLDRYQSLNLEDEYGLAYARMTLDELLPLIYGREKEKNSPQRINFDLLLYRSMPALSLESIREMGLVTALENIGRGKALEKEEDARRIAKLYNYKKSANEMAGNPMKAHLEKKYEEFQNYLHEQAKKPGPKEADVVGEGMLQNLIRHCVLLQEIYDPHFEGKMPEECAKMNCKEENRLQWFTPVEGQNNISLFKKSFCEKSQNLARIEEKYIKEFRNPSGAKICGQKVTQFFPSKK